MPTATEDERMHNLIATHRRREQEMTELVGMFLGACMADDMLAAEGASPADRQRAIEVRGQTANGLMRLLLEDLQISTLRFFNEVVPTMASTDTVPQ